MHGRANMRHKILWLGVLSLLTALGQPTAALAQAGVETGRSYAYGNLSVVDGDVWHQRADDFGAHEAERGSPFLPGDRIWTREPGQVELRFAGRVTAWMDQETKLDYVEGDSPHRLGFWTGSLIVWMGGDTGVVVETPGGTFSPQGEGEYRTDLLEDGRTVQFVVYTGIATVSTEWGSVLVGAGQRTIASEGTAPAQPEEYLGNDDFLAWTEDRQSRFLQTAGTPYNALPEEVQEYAHELDGYGRWHHDAHLGWAWYPRASSDWAPYRLGRWAHSPFGLTWVSYDPWGWAPYHYGRWGHGPLGWYWLPGSVWGPAWVSWGYGSDWVGWSPLGYNGYPVYGFYRYGDRYYGYGDGRGYGYRTGFHRGEILGKAVPRGSVNDKAWSFTRRDAVGRPASQSRLAASSLRNVENAQVLSRGAVLDRGLRQRAVGTTAMTRSAKATTRRLSNSRSAAGARREPSAVRSTSRGQRVAVPANAARARRTRPSYATGRDREVLATESARGGGGGQGAEAIRSGAASRPRAVSRDGAQGGAQGSTQGGTQGSTRSGPAATTSRRTGGAEADRGGARAAGRGTSAARPVRSPRPRATGSGDAGARRPSSVRPAAPRGSASSSSRSGASRRRPSSSAPRSRPSSSAPRSRPSSSAPRSRPSSSAPRSRPSSSAPRSRPSSSAPRSRPSSSAPRSRPSSSAPRSRPSSSAPRSRPSSSAPRSRPSSSAPRSRPSSSAPRSRPSSSAPRSRPSSSSSRSRPSASRTRPSGSRSRPSRAAASRPGGFSRFGGGGEGSSRQGSGMSSRGGGGSSGGSGGGGGSGVSGGGGGSTGGTAVSRGSSSGGSRRPNNN